MRRSPRSPRTPSNHPANRPGAGVTTNRASTTTKPTAYQARFFVQVGGWCVRHPSGGSGCSASRHVTIRARADGSLGAPGVLAPASRRNRAHFSPGMDDSSLSTPYPHCAVRPLPRGRVLDPRTMISDRATMQAYSAKHGEVRKKFPARGQRRPDVSHRMALRTRNRQVVRLLLNRRPRAASDYPAARCAKHPPAHLFPWVPTTYEVPCGDMSKFGIRTGGGHKKSSCRRHVHVVCTRFSGIRRRKRIKG